MILVDTIVDVATIVHVTRTIIAGGLRTDAVATNAPVTAPPPDPYAPIIADFRAAMTMLKCASSERVLRLGISMAQLHILYTLQRNGEMPMSRLAELLNVSLSNATGLIDRIEERGYVERTRVPEDRRVVKIRVTADGSRMLDEIDALSDVLLREVLGRIGPSKLGGVAQAATALREALAVATGGVPMDPHAASIPSPRSSSTLRGVERSTHFQPARKD
jgi:DNA-binding MarR family transcriptional regulator